MGLHGVELLLAVEESFGVTIADSEAVTCVTPAALTDLIFSKLRASDQRVCVNQRAFHLLRRALAETSHVPRRQVGLDADIRSLVVGSSSEREVWNNLKQSVHARRWPVLARPAWVVGMLWVLSLVTFAALNIYVHWLPAAVGGVLVAAVTVKMTERLRSRIPRRYSRVRDLVPFAATSDNIGWTRDEVALLVRELVIKHLDLSEGQYREDAHLVHDYGLGR